MNKCACGKEAVAEYNGEFYCTECLKEKLLGKVFLTMTHKTI